MSKMLKKVDEKPTKEPMKESTKWVWVIVKM